MPMNKKTVITVSILVMLTGCAAGFDEEFSCTEIGGAGGCVSMDHVRDNIDLYSSSNTSRLNQNPLLSAEGINNNFTHLPRRNRFGYPKRTDDAVRKVTIFPFIEKNGHYVDTTDIYIVLDESHWSGRPVQAVMKD